MPERPRSRSHGHRRRRDSRRREHRRADSRDTNRKKNRDVDFRSKDFAANERNAHSSSSSTTNTNIQPSKGIHLKSKETFLSNTNIGVDKDNWNREGRKYINFPNNH